MLYILTIRKHNSFRQSEYLQSMFKKKLKPKFKIINHKIILKISTQNNDKTHWWHVSGPGAAMCMIRSFQPELVANENNMLKEQQVMP